ncbi:F-box protein at5g49610 [Phtheirospermum japonicum]|uniref:F-box protein at5g49610 n=1 Tax=Phtheirospermum japonicum TaxID=374723 RepID=A0A830AZA2_9LAMI|nr:F-box protein at5g49610 [Phtheirospermum japonicum]
MFPLYQNVEENYIPLAHQQSCSSFQDISGFFCQREGTSPTFLSLNPSAYGVPTPTLGFLPDQVDIIASSHGLLVCRDRTGNNPYYVCNPATKNWKQLPKPEYYHGPDSSHVLAFELPGQKNDGHYQLVCAVPLIGQPIVCFEIYSSETGSWRCSEAICVELGYFSFEGVGFYTKGMAYWMTSEMQVLAFDLKNEVYGIMPLPFESSPCGGVLAQIHHELCYVGISNTSDDNYVIEMCCGYDLRLRQVIDLQLGSVPAGIGGYRILPYVEGDKLMILVGSVVYSYGLNDGEIEVISGEQEVEWPATAKFLPYANSLVRGV